MKARMLMVAVAAGLLAGCGNDVLDWDNARVSGGKIYEGSENKPFTGHVTNVPEQVLIPSNTPERKLLSLHFMNVELADRQEAMYGANLNCEVDTEDGLRDGAIVCRNAAGVVRVEGRFSEGAIDGEWKINDTKGQPSLSAKYSNGNLDGRLEILNPNGQGYLYKAGFKNGVHEGSEERWLGDGTQVLSTSWTDGKKDGLHKEWWNTGKLNYEVPYKNGQQDGLIKKYDDEGNVSRTVAPFDGQYARVTDYGPNGEVKISDVDRSGIYHPVSVQPAQPQPQDSAEPDGLVDEWDAAVSPANQQCVDAWTAYARKVEGDEFPIGLETLKDWNSMCSSGEQPPAG